MALTVPIALDAHGAALLATIDRLTVVIANNPAVPEFAQAKAAAQTALLVHLLSQNPPKLSASYLLECSGFVEVGSVAQTAREAERAIAANEIAELRQQLQQFRKREAVSRADQVKQHRALLQWWAECGARIPLHVQQSA
jgi:hypothetical protein